MPFKVVLYCKVVMYAYYKDNDIFGIHRVGQHFGNEALRILKSQTIEY